MSIIHIDKSLDTDIKGANEIGEALRNYIFVNDGNSKYFNDVKQYGCYETFKVRSESIELSEEEADEIVEKYSGVDGSESESRAFKFVAGKALNPIVMIVAWSWDHDGFLLFEGPDFVVINPDCKKDDKWYYGSLL